MRRRPTEEEERVDPLRPRPPRSLCLSGRRPECRGGGGERRGGGNQNNGGSRCLALCVRVCARDERNKGGGAETSDAFGSRTKRPMKQKKKGGEEERSNDMRGGATHEGMHEQRRTSALFGFAVRHSAHSAACRAELPLPLLVRVGTDCSLHGSEPEKSEDSRQHAVTSAFQLASCRGGGGRGRGRVRGRGRSRTTVQCLVGPLLWATGWEMSVKAERIRPKDLSLRVDTSSDVMPSVSIFGRIFNRMVPDLNCFSFRR